MYTSYFLTRNNLDKESVEKWLYHIKKESVCVCVCVCVCSKISLTNYSSLNSATKRFVDSESSKFGPQSYHQRTPAPPKNENITRKYIKKRLQKSLAK